MFNDIRVLALSRFQFSKTAQEPLKTAQEAPERTPRRPRRPLIQPKSAPGEPQEGHKRRNPNSQSEPAPRRRPPRPLAGPRQASKRPQERPRGPTNTPRKASRSPNGGSKHDERPPICFPRYQATFQKALQERPPKASEATRVFDTVLYLMFKPFVGNDFRGPVNLSRPAA